MSSASAVVETRFETIEGKSAQFRLLLGVLVLLIGAGLWASWVMFAQGLHVTGLGNRVPWGLQIVMAVYYIGLSAGSLVIARRPLTSTSGTPPMSSSSFRRGEEISSRVMPSLGSSPLARALPASVSTSACIR